MWSASGEPPVLLAKSVHSALRCAIAAAREDLQHLPVADVYQKTNGVASNLKAGLKGGGFFRMDTPASIDVVKALCGLDNVERYLASLA
jgi:abscisic-aldehyde oxidase